MTERGHEAFTPEAKRPFECPSLSVRPYRQGARNRKEDSFIKLKTILIVTLFK